MTSNVDHSNHYNQGGKETIEILKDFLTENEFKGFLKGNVLKYMHRYYFKNGLEDLSKAQWYLNKLRETESETTYANKKSDSAKCVYTQPATSSCLDYVYGSCPDVKQ